MAQYSARCRHFTGLRYLACRAGVAYASVKDPTGSGHYPCFGEHGCSHLCSQVCYETAEDRAEADREVAAKAAKYVNVLAEGRCPECGQEVRGERQVGRCVYAEPCGHRFFQGRADPAKEVKREKPPAVQPQLAPAAPVEGKPVSNRRLFKAISLWQPWASLMASGAKRVETRTWQPYGIEHGQLVAIHAAKRWTYEELLLAGEDPRFVEALTDAAGRGLWDIIAPPLGCVVALARFDRAVRTDELADGTLSELERGLGDYSSGRWAWLFDAARPLRPVAFAGKQKIFGFELPADFAYLEVRNEAVSFAGGADAHPTRRPELATVPVRIQHCRSCNAEVVWCCHVVSGKRAPIDAAVNPTGNITINATMGDPS